jgi:hypothetical protein
MNKPSIRERVIEARTHLTHARIQLQAAEADAGKVCDGFGDTWGAILTARIAAQDAEAKSRHALDSMPEDGGSET